MVLSGDEWEKNLAFQFSGSWLFLDIVLIINYFPRSTMGLDSKGYFWEQYSSYVIISVYCISILPLKHQEKYQMETELSLSIIRSCVVSTGSKRGI